MCQNLSPIGLSVYKLQLFKWNFCCKFSKQQKKSEFCGLIKHCLLIGKNTVQAKKWLDKCYSDSAPSETMIKRWYPDFKHVRTDTNNAEHSVHLNSAVVPENTKKLHKLFLADRKFKLREIVVIYEALCFDVAQGQMNGTPNETRTHLCRFASLVC